MVPRSLLLLAALLGVVLVVAAAGSSADVNGGVDGGAGAVPVPVAAGGATPAGLATSEEEMLSPEEREQRKLVRSYQTHFSIKRSEQVKAAEAIFAKKEYEQRYDLTKALLDELFRTMRKAQKELEAVDLAALPPIPVKEKKVLESLLKIWENTAFFGDLILRLPDIVHLQFDSQEVRKSLMKWALNLCLASPIYEDVHKRQLALVLQETRLAESVDPNYANPFSEATMEAERKKLLQKRREDEREDVKRRKREAMRKPRMSKTEL